MEYRYQIRNMPLDVRLKLRAMAILKRQTVAQFLTELIEKEWQTLGETEATDLKTNITRMVRRFRR